jgi:hypothetical protein
MVAQAGARLREAIDEQDFCASSSGLRPGRRPHQALHDGRQGRLGNRIGHGIDCDIRAFFDN